MSSTSSADRARDSSTERWGPMVGGALQKGPKFQRRWIEVMSDRAGENETGIGARTAVEAALSDLTTWVYDSHVTRFLRPRQLTTHHHLDGRDGAGRAASVSMFKHLKHFGVTWDVHEVCDWATRRGWVSTDIALLRTFAQGVQSGTRFHTGPQPWPDSFVESWLRGVPMIATKRSNNSLKIKSAVSRGERNTWSATRSCGQEDSEIRNLLTGIVDFASGVRRHRSATSQWPFQL
jgi:hypothetical protein